MMATSKSTYQTGGAVAGGAIGTAVGGPVGTLVGGGLGSIAGGLLYDAFNGDPVQDAEADKMKAMGLAAGAYQDYRPGVMVARQQGLGQQLSAMNGADNALRLMYGREYDPRMFAPNVGQLPVPQSVGQQVGNLSGGKR